MKNTAGELLGDVEVTFGSFDELGVFDLDKLKNTNDATYRKMFNMPGQYSVTAHFTTDGDFVGLLLTPVESVWVETITVEHVEALEDRLAAEMKAETAATTASS